MMKKSLFGRIASITLCALMTSYGPAFALPVPTGTHSSSVNITKAEKAMTISTGNREIINYTSFDIGADEAVRFIQPSSSSVVLNRVSGASASSLAGALSANGNVFLVNPNGIVIGAGAVINTASFVASALNISDADFMSGNYRFAGGNGTVTNAGRIIVDDGGYVGLIGARVTNSGTIVARRGKVALAAGGEVTMDMNGDGLLSFAVDGKLADALVKNSGTINADGGSVLLTASAADDIATAVVNNEGVIKAQSVVNDGGVIRLVATHGGAVSNSGTLDVSAKGEGAAGGSVELSGVSVANTGSVLATGSEGATGGSFKVGGSTDPVEDQTGTESGTGEDAGAEPADQATASVVNDFTNAGTIDVSAADDAAGGSVAVEALSTIVNDNTGLINADGGSISLVTTDDANGGITNAGTLKAEDGSIELESAGTVDLTGNIEATDGTLDIDAQGAVTHTGSLKADVVHEQGASCLLGGYKEVNAFYANNADGAADLTGNVAGGDYYDNDNWNLNGAITLLGDVNIYAGVDGTGSIIDNASTIDGGGFNLAFYSAEDSTVGVIFNLSGLTFSRLNGSSPTYLMNQNIIAAGMAAAVGIDTTLDTSDHILSLASLYLDYGSTYNTGTATQSFATLSGHGAVNFEGLGGAQTAITTLNLSTYSTATYSAQGGAVSMLSGTYGNLHVNDGGVASTYTFAGDSTINGNLQNFGGTLTLGTNTINVTGNFNCYDQARLANGTTLDVNGNVLAGDFQVAGGGTATINVGGNWGGVYYFDPQNSTIVFDGGGTSILTTGWDGTGGTQGNYDFRTIEVSNTTTLQVITNPLYSMNIVLTSGTLDMETGDQALTLSNSLDVQAGSTYKTGTAAQTMLSLGNSGTIECEGLAFDGTNLQITTLTNNAGSTFYYTAATGSPVVKGMTYHNIWFNDNGGDAVYTPDGNLTVNGELRLYGGTVALGDWTTNVTGNVNSNDTISINSGTLDIDGNFQDVGVFSVTGNANILLAGNWASDYWFSAGGSTVTFNGGGAQSVTMNGSGAGHQFRDFVVDKAGGALTFGSDVEVLGNFNLTHGVVNLNGFDLDVTGNYTAINTSTTNVGAGTLSCNDITIGYLNGNSGTISVGGSWIFNSANDMFTAGTSTVEFTKAGVVSLNTHNSLFTDFANLSIADGTTLQVTGDLVASGLVTIGGTLDLQANDVRLSAGSINVGSTGHYQTGTAIQLVTGAVTNQGQLECEGLGFDGTNLQFGSLANSADSVFYFTSQVGGVVIDNSFNYGSMWFNDSGADVTYTLAAGTTNALGNIRNFGGTIDIGDNTLNVGGYVQNYDTILLNAGTLTMLGDFNEVGNLTSNANASINVGGAWQNVYWFNRGTSTVTFTGAGSTLNAGGIVDGYKFYNLAVGAGATLTLLADAGAASYTENGTTNYGTYKIYFDDGSYLPSPAPGPSPSPTPGPTPDPGPTPVNPFNFDVSVLTRGPEMPDAEIKETSLTPFALRFWGQDSSSTISGLRSSVYGFDPYIYAGEGFLRDVDGLGLFSGIYQGNQNVAGAFVDN